MESLEDLSHYALRLGRMPATEGLLVSKEATNAIPQAKTHVLSR
jgi:hypothetical protein